MVKQNRETVNRPFGRFCFLTHIVIHIKIGLRLFFCQSKMFLQLGQYDFFVFPLFQVIFYKGFNAL